MRTGHAGIHRRFQRTGSCWSSDCLADGTDCLEHRGYRAHELADCAFAGSKLDDEQQILVRKEIAGLVQRKIELYPRQMTAIRDVTATLANGSPRAKARPGDTFPELSAKPVSEPEKPLCSEDIAALRKEMKLTQVKFGELFGVPARKVSEWEHGKSQPSAEQSEKMNSLNKENIQ